MKELVEKVAALYAEFTKDAELQIEMVTKQPVLVPAKLHWNWKKQ